MTTATEIVAPQRTMADSLAEKFFAPESPLLVAIKQAMPQSIIPPEAIARAAISAIRASDSLQRCTPYSLICAIFEAAQAQLSLDVNLGQAYLVPFAGTAKLIYGYRGLCELARRSGEISKIVGELRYGKDEWQISLGTHRELHHIPADLPPSKRGAILGVYAVAEFTMNGRPDFEYMTIEEVEKIRDAVLRRKKSDKPSPWETNFEEMARKTPIRRIAKRLPQSAAFMPIIIAAIRDEYREAGIREVPELPAPLEQALREQGIEPSLESPEPEPERPMPQMPRRKTEAKANSKPASRAKAKQRRAPGGNDAGGPRPPSPETPNAEKAATPSATELLTSAEAENIFRQAHKVAGGYDQMMELLKTKLYPKYGIEKAWQLPRVKLDDFMRDLKEAGK